MNTTIDKSVYYYNLRDDPIYRENEDEEFKQKNKIRKMKHDEMQKYIDTLNLVKLKSNYLDMRHFYYDPIQNDYLFIIMENLI